MNAGWPREESNLRSQIRSSVKLRSAETHRDESALPSHLYPIVSLWDLGRSRWVWWPHIGPIRTSQRVIGSVARRCSVETPMLQ
jgi:hypothetical protein